MDEKETELKRRDVLKRGAVAAGALVVGGTAMAGSAAAAPKAVAYVDDREDPEGDVLTLKNDEPDDPVRCHQPAGADGHEVEQWFTSPARHLAVQSDSLSLQLGDTVKVVKVIGECREGDWYKVQIEEV